MNKRKTIYLHIGSPKTGTKTIQKFLYENKDKLLENGILYPIEIKMSTVPKTEMASEFDVLDGIPDKKRGMGTIICLIDRKLYLRENLIALPLDYV